MNVEMMEGEMTKEQLNKLIDEIVIPENVQLGHTWLKRKLKEAVNKLNEK